MIAQTKGKSKLFSFSLSIFSNIHNLFVIYLLLFWRGYPEFNDCSIEISSFVHIYFANGIIRKLEII